MTSQLLNPAHYSPDIIAANPHLFAPAHTTKPARAALRGAAPTEHDEQVELFDWAREQEAACPDLALLYAIPNGGHRFGGVAVKLHAEGVKAGVPDMCLPVARGGYHGLYIELKRADGSNHATPEQEQWLDRLTDEGYLTMVCYGAAEAREEIESYLGWEEAA